MGEIEISSPSVLYEYIDHATEALVTPFAEEYWRPTGDVGLIRKCASGAEHLFIVDRIRDMIKVKVSKRGDFYLNCIANLPFCRATKSLPVRSKIISCNILLLPKPPWLALLMR